MSGLSSTFVGNDMWPRRKNEEELQISLHPGHRLGYLRCRSTGGCAAALLRLEPGCVIAGTRIAGPYEPV